MKVLDRLAKLTNRKSKKTFDESPSWLIAPLGSLAFLVASYLGLMFADVIPDFIKTINRVGINVVAIKIAIILIFYAIPIWYFGCIAAKCHTVLYDRWFK